VAAASVNPVDYKRRAGLTTEFYPLKFPGLIGVDVAGTVIRLGPGVEGFSIGDPVFAMADDTYAELCVVKAAILAKVPKGLDLIEAAALPLATTTGNQLLLATKVDVGQTVLVAGAAWKCWTFGGIHGEDARGDCHRRGHEEAARWRENYRRGSSRRNRR
jgi:NADPH:quinone reductase-like Zn-dependent oxidoreductase